MVGSENALRRLARGAMGGVRGAPVEQERAAIAIRSVVDREEWERAIEAHPLSNLFASWSWGEYKRRIGFGVDRLVLTNRGGDLVALVQVQSKTRFGVKIHYVQGGPLSATADLFVAEEATRALVDRLSPDQRSVVVVNFQQFDSDAARGGLLAAGFVPVQRRCDYTLHVPLDADLATIEQRFGSTLRRQLRKTRREGRLECRIPESADDRAAAFDRFVPMYEALKEKKGFDTSLDLCAFRDIAVEEDRFVFVEVLDQSEVVAVRIAARSKHALTDFFAASADAARKSLANYYAIWALIEYGVRNGLDYFDAGGIDPAGNRAVYDFKRHLSDKVVETGPIWVFSRNRALRAAVVVALTFSA